MDFCNDEKYKNNILLTYPFYLPPKIMWHNSEYLLFEQLKDYFSFFSLIHKQSSIFLENNTNKDFSFCTPRDHTFLLLRLDGILNIFINAI